MRLKTLIPLTLILLVGCGGSNSPLVSTPLPKCTLDFATPNYALDTDPTRQVANELRFWPSFPLTIHVKNSLAQATANGPQTTNELLSQALQRWIDASNNQIQFKFTDDPTAADITLEFKETPSRPGPGEALGETTVTYYPSNSQLISAQIIVHYWPELTEEEFTLGLRATLTHELGHALFLQGHSPAPEDNMFNINNPTQDKPLTQRDINTFLTAYCGNFNTATRSRYNSPESPVSQTITCSH